MQETGNNALVATTRLTVRVSSGTLSFSVLHGTAEKQVVYEPYLVRSGISMAANLREAFGQSELLLRGYQRVQVMTDTPVLMVPIERFDENQLDILYNHAFSNQQSQEIIYTVMPNLNAVAVFSINKDLKLVFTDHFSDVRFHPLMQPVWNYLHNRSFTGNRRKLYAYFHDKKLEIFCFHQNRFKFVNSYEVTYPHDAVYFVLHVWKVLSYDARCDELHLAGNMPQQETMLEEMRRYVQNTYVINATAEFNHSPVTSIKGMPFDLITLYEKGR